MRGSTVRIGVVAGEPSGDSLGAGLINAVKRIYPDAEFVGVGGPKMRKAGCDTLYDMDRIGLMGLEGIFEKLGDILKIRASLYRMFVANPPDLFVGIDVPDFNLALERKLKKKNIKIVHYVSPTVWAWRGYRIHKIRRAVSHMLTLFPFEADYYKKHKIPVTCVGHPIADEIDNPDTMAARKRIGIGGTTEKLVIGLLPGSRASEVKKLATVFVEAVTKINHANPSIQFVLPFASSRMAEVFYQVAGPIDHLPVTPLDGQSRDAMEASDIIILASGTAALEAALLHKPHIVVYKLNAITYWLINKLKHVDYYSMPNQLLPEPVIPEYMQDEATADNIVDAVYHYINHPQEVKKLEQEFIEIHRQLKLDANFQASQVVGQMLEATS